MPHGHEAAIFEGYSLDDTARIKESETKKLARLGRVLTAMRQSYRAAMENNPDDYAAMYHSRVPRPSTADLVDQGLRDLLDD